MERKPGSHRAVMNEFRRQIERDARVAAAAGRLAALVEDVLAGGVDQAGAARLRAGLAAFRQAGEG